MKDEGSGDKLHLFDHRRLSPCSHLGLCRQLLRPGSHSWFLSETGPIIGIQSVVGVCWNFFLFICKCWRWWNWILKLLYWVKSLNWVSSTHCLSLSCNVLPPISEVPRPDDFYQTRSIVLCCKQVSGNQQVMNFTHRYKVVDYFLRREQNMDT